MPLPPLRIVFADREVARIGGPFVAAININAPESPRQQATQFFCGAEYGRSVDRGNTITKITAQVWRVFDDNVAPWRFIQTHREELKYQGDLFIFHRGVVWSMKDASMQIGTPSILGVSLDVSYTFSGGKLELKDFR